MTTSHADPAALRKKFEDALGYWDPACEQVLAAAPEYFAVYVDYVAAPRKMDALTPKVRELVYITVNASTTHLYAPALRLHIANALRLGATAAEIMQVFQLISILGVHGVAFSLPILVEVAAQSGHTIDTSRLSARQQAIRDSFKHSRGFWPPKWDTILALAPDFLAEHVRFGAFAQESGPLDAKTRQLVLTAVDAATTHLWADGVQSHIDAALQNGATVAELTEVILLTSTLGLHSVTFGTPILMEELAKLNRAA